MKRLKDEKGMMSVEVIIGLVIYIAFFVIFMNLLNVVYIKQKIQAAMKPIAIQVSRDYCIDSTITEGGGGYEKVMLSNIMQRRKQGYHTMTASYTPTQYYKYYTISKARDMLFMLTADFKSMGYASTQAYVDMWIVGGFNGISFNQTMVDENGSGEIELVVEYRIRIMELSLFGHAGIYIPVKQTASTLLWE